jgi:hypothetical protein
MASTVWYRGPALKKVGINLLKDVEELKIQWLTFNSWGGWISEKFQSLSRICALDLRRPYMVVDDVPPFVEPEGHTVDQWYKEDYKKWFKVRGEPTKGDKDLLKERVMNFRLTSNHNFYHWNAAVLTG